MATCTVKGHVQVIVENVDVELSSPNGLVSTRDMATIEKHSKSPVQSVPDTIHLFSKAEMSNPICFDGEDEMIPYSSRKKQFPPSLPQHDLPDEYFEAQRICYERAGVNVLRAGSQHILNTPPIETAFRENALYGNLAVAIWRNCLKIDPPALDPTEHGWYHPEGSATLSQTVVPLDSPLAPAKLIKLLKCSYSSETPCATKRCSCKANGLTAQFSATAEGRMIATTNIPSNYIDRNILTLLDVNNYIFQCTHTYVYIYIYIYIYTYIYIYIYI